MVSPPQVLSPEDKAFIKFVRQECKKEGIRCRLTQGKYIVADGVRMSGYFDEHAKILTSALKANFAVAILAHEFGHLIQWRDKHPLHLRLEKMRAYEDFWVWLGSDKKPPKDVPKIISKINCIRDYELDNEKRTVNLIKKHRLSQDLDEYTRSANYYIHFFNHIKKTRKWTTPTDEQNAYIRSHMSTKFNMNYRTLEPWIEKLFLEQNA